MATITITVPAENAMPYLEQVLHQINAGYTSGHVDRDTHWDTQFDSGEDHFAS